MKSFDVEKGIITQNTKTVCSLNEADPTKCRSYSKNVYFGYTSQFSKFSKW